jgi:hypothetical protein
VQVAEAGVASVPSSASAIPPAREPRLRIVSDPVGAQITLSGRNLGRAPLTTDPLQPDANYEVMASLEGYQSVRRLVRTAEGVTEVTLFMLVQRAARTKPAPNPPR